MNQRDPVQIVLLSIVSICTLILIPVWPALIIVILLALESAGFAYMFWPRKKKNGGHEPPEDEKKLSILIPFASHDHRRIKTMKWIEKFYKAHLPHNTEFIVGVDFSTPFCKTAAVNSAAKEATGDIFIIMDADCLIDPVVIMTVADRIRDAYERGIKTWFVPYRRFYRLTEDYSDEVLERNPERSFRETDPPEWDDYEHVTTNVSAGHWWGALIQIMPRSAFIAAGGMDERFRGWGGEDISFLHAVDTLWGRHKTQDAAVFHLWHHTKKGRWQATRMWDGQTQPEMNDWLAGKYESAKYDYDTMLRLTREGMSHKIL